MAEIDVLKAQIVRQGDEAWGFRLEGGATNGTPCKINMISPGSPASRIGLKSSDVITEIGDVPTEGMTLEQVWNIIDQATDSLIITVERRARGTIPVNPVVTPSDQPERMSYQPYNLSGGSQPRPRSQNYIPVGNVVTGPDGGLTVYAPPPPRPDIRPERKSYQTFDLNGPRQYVPPTQQHNYQFHTANSRPFEDRPKPYYSPPAPASPASQPPPQSPPHSPQQQNQAYTSSVNFHPQPVNQQQNWEPQQRVPEEERQEDGIPQSRTFRVLQSLMQNDEPKAGVAALPPPRSASSEAWKREQDAKRAGGGGPRVKVFMPQQYNSPMGMYSAQNVVETFAAQAETVMDAMERPESGQEMAPAAIHNST